jgi:hypothetical protein
MTIIIDPKAFFTVTFSWKKIIPTNVENKAPVEDNGTARDSKVFIRLKK